MAMRDDAEARAVTVGAMLTAGWAVFSFYPIVVFPVIEGRRESQFPIAWTITDMFAAPRWTKGYSVNIAFVFFCWLFFMIGQYFYGKDEKRRAQAAVPHESKDEEDGVDANEKAAGEIVEHIEKRG
jgi:hypothetical protein